MAAVRDLLIQVQPGKAASCAGALQGLGAQRAPVMGKGVGMWLKMLNQGQY